MIFGNISSFLRKSKGFTLVEMLISIVIFAIVMGMIYTYLLKTKTNITSTQEELEAAENAQTAMRALRGDLTRIGYGRDAEQDQPQLLKLGPYEIVFTADLDQDNPRQTERFGSYVPISGEAPPASRPEFYAISNLLHDSTETGWNTGLQYGSYYIGAEIIRYSLDYTGDRRIKRDDTEDIIAAGDIDLGHNANPADFWLVKEWWGCVSKSGGGYENQHSGKQPVAFNIRGNLFDPGNTLDRTDFIYPNGNHPPILFEYWGHFYNTVTTNDSPQDDDWDGEPMELWGDWGNIGPPTNQDVDMSTIPPLSGFGDGVLDQVEINRLLNDPSLATVSVLFPEDVSDPTNIAMHDRNGNGFSDEKRLDEIVRRISINILTETGTPNRDLPNMERSSPPGNMYYFRDYEISFDISPPNLVLSGAPVVKVTPPTSTPIPYSPTPFVPSPTAGPGTPTNTPIVTPGPSATPTVGPGTPTNTPFDTSTPLDTPTPTPTPINEFGHNRDEILIGTSNGLLGFALNPVASDPQIIAEGASRLLFFGQPYGSAGDTIAIESVNFSDPYLNPDDWNDLLFASNHTQINEPNLFYVPHISFEGLRNGFDWPALRQIRIGSGNSFITDIAVGNIDLFNGSNVDDLYPEVFVSWYDIPTQSSYVSIVPLSRPSQAQYPYFLNPICDNYFLAGSKIIDIETNDFDSDGYTELAILTDANDGITPQIIVFDDLHECYTSGWSNEVYSNASLWLGDKKAVKMHSGQLISGSEWFPDIAVMSETGILSIIPNKYDASNNWLGFNQNFICNPNVSISPNIDPAMNYMDFSIYSVDYLTSNHEWLTLVSEISTNHYQTFTNLTAGDGCNIFTNQPFCSGTLFESSEEGYPMSVFSTKIERNSELIPLILVASRFPLYGNRYRLKLIAKPCDISLPGVQNASEYDKLQSNPVFCMTSTKNALTGEAPNLPPIVMTKSSVKNSLKHLN